MKDVGDEEGGEGAKAGFVDDPGHRCQHRTDRLLG